jgi:hypothetical protein
MGKNTYASGQRFNQEILVAWEIVETKTTVTWFGRLSADVTVGGYYCNLYIKHNHVIQSLPHETLRDRKNNIGGRMMCTLKILRRL